MQIARLDGAVSCTLNGGSENPPNTRLRMSSDYRLDFTRQQAKIV